MQYKYFFKTDLIIDETEPEDERELIMVFVKYIKHDKDSKKKRNGLLNGLIQKLLRNVELLIILNQVLN
tara:strand:+ start:601 stop:807 length:207 start_codon:yes stop_codon:yes gene_type:complete